MQWDWSSLSLEDMQFYRDICPENEYRIIPLSSGVPGIPAALAAKCPYAFIAASGDASGQVYYMANLQRIDFKDSAIDQQPLGFVFNSKVPMLSGVMIQHGTWAGRTTHPSQSAWMDVASGKINAFHDLSIFPSITGGSIQELKSSSQIGAFSTVIAGLSGQYQDYIKNLDLFQQHPTIEFFDESMQPREKPST